MKKLSILLMIAFFALIGCDKTNDAGKQNQFASTERLIEPGKENTTIPSLSNQKAADFSKQEDFVGYFTYFVGGNLEMHQFCSTGNYIFNNIRGQWSLVNNQIILNNLKEYQYKCDGKIVNIGGDSACDGNLKLDGVKQLPNKTFLDSKMILALQKNGPYVSWKEVNPQENGFFGYEYPEQRGISKEYNETKFHYFKNDKENECDLNYEPPQQYKENSINKREKKTK